MSGTLSLGSQYRAQRPVDQSGRARRDRQQCVQCQYRGILPPGPEVRVAYVGRCRRRRGALADQPAGGRGAPAQHPSPRLGALNAMDAQGTYYLPASGSVRTARRQFLAQPYPRRVFRRHSVVGGQSAGRPGAARGGALGSGGSRQIQSRWATPYRIFAWRPTSASVRRWMRSTACSDKIAETNKDIGRNDAVRPKHQ